MRAVSWQVKLAALAVPCPINRGVSLALTAENHAQALKE